MRLVIASILLKGGATVLHVALYHATNRAIEKSPTWRPQGIATTIDGGYNGHETEYSSDDPCGRHVAGREPCRRFRLVWTFQSPCATNTQRDRETETCDNKIIWIHSTPPQQLQLCSEERKRSKPVVCHQHARRVSSMKGPDLEAYGDT